MRWRGKATSQVARQTMRYEIEEEEEALGGWWSGGKWGGGNLIDARVKRYVSCEGVRQPECRGPALQGRGAGVGDGGGNTEPATAYVVRLHDPVSGAMEVSKHRVLCGRAGGQTGTK